MFRKHAAALLPATQALFETRAILPQRAGEIWDEVAIYVAENCETGKVVFLSSCGRFSGDKWAIGTHHDIMHDQTHANLGYFKIINIIEVVKGKVTSDNDLHVDKKHPIWVFK